MGLWAVAILFVGGLWLYDAGRLSSLRPELQAAQSEFRQFRVLIAQKQQMEQLRDSLATELQAIREIDSDRYVWPHIMREVTASLPDFTWLVTLQNLTAGAAVVDDTTQIKPPVRFVIEGRTSDIQAYTRFARRLEESPWVRDITLGATQTVIEDERSVTSFQITAEFQTADSAFIRTQPVAESVR